VDHREIGDSEELVKFSFFLIHYFFRTIGHDFKQDANIVFFMDFMKILRKLPGGVNLPLLFRFLLSNFERSSIRLLSMKGIILIFILILNLPLYFAQEEVDSLMPVDSTLVLKTIEVPEFKLIDSDTITLGEYDELICDSYSARGVPWVYDALHSFNRRRMDYFGGYMNVQVNAALERVRSNGFRSDIKKLYIQIVPLSLTVYWIAVVGPSKDGNCYACIDSRGSAGGGLSAVNKQLYTMHSKYSGMEPVMLLDFNDNVIQCYEGDGTPLTAYCTYVNIRQKFYKYAVNCYNSVSDSVIVHLDFPNTGSDTYKGGDIEQKQLVKKVNTPSYKKHKVKSGDTLSEIARKYHTSMAAIKKLNHLRSDTIRIGQVLKIPL